MVSGRVGAPLTLRTFSIERAGVNPHEVPVFYLSSDVWRQPFSYSEMRMKVTVVLFIAEGGQNLATTMLVDDFAGDPLHDLQQVSTQSWLQLQQRPNMALRDHEHVISPETLNRRPERQHLLGLADHINLDQPGEGISRRRARLSAAAI